MKSYCILGTSGHAKVVASAIEATGDAVVCMIHDNDRVPPETSHLIIAIGDNRTRYKIDLEWPTSLWGRVIHPSATVHSSAKIGDGAQILYNAVVEPDVIVGRHVIINSGATVAHDCVVGDYVHVGPGVHLAGGVHVDEGTFIGIGSSVIQNVQIGEWSIVGAGSVVVRNIPPHALAYGVPGRVRRVLSQGG